MSLNFLSSTIGSGLQQYIENNGQGSSTNPLCVEVAGALYFITIAQVGVSQATRNLWIIKSTDQGSTWRLVYNGLAGSSGGFQCLSVCVSGTTIYIVVTDVNTTVPKVVPFDTVTQALGVISGGAPIFPVATGSIGACAFGDGSLLVAGSDTGGSNGNLAVARYVPGSNTWSLAVTVDGPAFDIGIAGVIADPVTTNRAYLFYTTSANQLTYALKCISITNPTTAGTPQTLGSISTPNGVTPAVQYNTGLPCVTSTQVVIPAITPGNPQSPAANVLYAYRASFAANPSFSVQTVQSGITGHYITTYQQGNPVTPAAAVWYGSTLYIFYSTDNGNLDSAQSLSTLYYQTLSGASWTSPIAAANSVISREPMTPYPVVISSAQLGVFWPLANPVTFLDTTDPNAKINSLAPMMLVQGANFSLQKMSVFLKRDARKPIRGAAQ